MKSAIILLNYNMPEVIAQWDEYLQDTVLNLDNYWVVDNGSENYGLARGIVPDENLISVNKNLRTTGGVMLGVYYAKMMGCTHVWTISTSTLPPDLPWRIDPLVELENGFDYDNVLAVTPTFTGESTSWPHLLNFSDGSDDYETHWLLGLFALWDIDFLMEHVDQRMTWSWGVDMEISAMCRIMGYRMIKANGVTVQLYEGLGYKQDRMTCSQYDREKYARAEMEKYLTEKWGEHWKEKLIPYAKYRLQM
jgi:hypothetical protein